MTLAKAARKTVAASWQTLANNSFTEPPDFMQEKTMNDSTTAIDQDACCHCFCSMNTAGDAICCRCRFTLERTLWKEPPMFHVGKETE